MERQGAPFSKRQAHGRGSGCLFPLALSLTLGLRLSAVPMATRALEELDGGLGSCQMDEDLSALADPGPGWPREDSAQGTRAGAGGGSACPHPPSESGGPPSETRTWTSTLDWLKPCSLFPTSVPISVPGGWGWGL